MKKILIGLISAYQKTLSLDTGYIPKVLGFSRPTCPFYPTCSEYTKQAVEKYGISKGFTLGLKRLKRCTPWQKPEVDLLP